MSELDAERWKARFAEYLRPRRSPETVETYLHSLTGFFAFADSLGLTRWSELTSDHLEAYRGHLMAFRSRGKPLARATQNLRLTGLKAFLKWLHRARYLPVNLAVELDLLRLPRRVPGVLSEAEIERLLRAVDLSNPLGVRDRAVLEVLYGTALRNGELCRLELGQLDWQGPALVIHAGKGQHGRVVPLGEEAASWLRRYLEVRPQLLRQDGQRMVFLTYRGLPFAKDTLVTLVARWARVAGLTQKVTPHTLRHSCATHMLARGAGLRQLQTLLGHSTCETTQQYAQVELSHLRQVLHRCHPRERARRRSEGR